MKRCILFVPLCVLLSISATPMQAGTSFTYQGRLSQNGNPAHGMYDLSFKLFDSVSGSSQLGSTVTLPGVAASNGLFTVALDFGSAAFDGSPRWLEIVVATNGSTAGAVTLAPRQPITSSPYAILADKVSGPISDGQLSGNIARLDGAAVFSGMVSAAGFTGNGFGLTNINATTLDGLGPQDFWRLTGNSGTAAGIHFLGTADEKPVEFRANNSRALRLEPATNGAPNLIGGSAQNSITSGTGGATIGGGDANTMASITHFSSIAGGAANRISAARFATIAGGSSNLIGESSHGSVIAGGNSNTITSVARHSAIGGGSANLIENLANNATIGGGVGNRVARSDTSTIAGGGQNNVVAFAVGCAIGGGTRNVIGPFNGFCAIVGGDTNVIEGFSDASTIAGGGDNVIGSNAQKATISGGFGNRIDGGGSDNFQGSTIGGGIQNTNTGDYATVPGGLGNVATAFAFAAGTRAKAIHPGAFVWSDSNPAPALSTASNQFTARASGGVRFLTDPQGTTGATLAPGSGSWSSLSDRDVKTNFTRVDPRQILGRVANLPIYEWSYKAQDPSVRHLGPTAQDFHAAFGNGEDDRRISAVDADGVALAAIKGLYELLREKDAELQELRNEVRALSAKLSNGLPRE